LQGFHLQWPFRWPTWPARTVGSFAKIKTRKPRAMRHDYLPITSATELNKGLLEGANCKHELSRNYGSVATGFVGARSDKALVFTRHCERIDSIKKSQE